MAKNLKALGERLGTALGKGSKQAHSSATSKPVPRTLVGSTPVPKLSVSVYEKDMDILNGFSTELISSGVRTPSRSGILRAAARVIEEHKDAMIGNQTLKQVFLHHYSVMEREDDGRRLRKLNRLASEDSQPEAAASAKKKAPTKKKK